MLNNATIMGRFTSDPELRFTNSNTPVVSFTLACDRDIKDADGNKKVDFLDCVAYRTTAEFISKNFVKGQQTVVSGRLQIRDWTDKNGNKRRNTDIAVKHIYFADSKKTENAIAELPDDDEPLPWEA